jgi:hypothetical protein
MPALIAATIIPTPAKKYSKVSEKPPDDWGGLWAAAGSALLFVTETVTVAAAGS